MMTRSLSLGFSLPILASALLLTACQSTFNHQTGVFRNREFDYLHQPVNQRPPLVIPKGVSTPAFSPKNTLPAGPDHYAAASSVDMTPPGFHTVVPMPASVKSTPAPAPSSEPAAKPSDDSAAINAKIRDLKAQLNALQAKSGGTTPAAIPAAPSLPTTTPAEATAPTLVSSSLSFDHNNVGLLRINAPFKTSWNTLLNAISASGYTVTKVDLGSHLIFVTAPKSDDPHGEMAHYLLFAERHANTTHVSVFTEKGVLDSSASAGNFLTQLQAKIGNGSSS